MMQYSRINPDNLDDCIEKIIQKRDELKTSVVYKLNTGGHAAAIKAIIEPYVRKYGDIELAVDAEDAAVVFLAPYTEE